MQGEKIAEVRFLAQGCVAAVGCASAMTELVAGKTLAQARNLQRQEIVAAVGGLPEESSHASYLAIDALQALMGQLPR